MNFFYFLCVLAPVFSINSFAQKSVQTFTDCDAAIGGNWNTAGTWGCGTVPTTTDNARWYDGKTVTVDMVGAVCANVNIGLFSGAGNSTLLFNNGMSLISTGATYIGWGGTTNGVIDMTSGGTFTAATWVALNTVPSLVPGTGTIKFTGTFTIPNYAGLDDFNDLEIGVGASTNTVTLSRAITVRNLTIASGCTLNAAGFGITVTGDWTNNGTFTHGNNIVTFNGTGAQAITGSATQTFYNIVVNKASGTLSKGGSTTTLTCNDYTNTLGDFDASGFTSMNVNSSASTSDVILTAGTFTAPATINVTGDWSNNGGTFTPGTNTVNFTGTGAQAINGTGTAADGAQAFYHFVVAKAAGQTLSVNGGTTSLSTQDYTQTTGDFTGPSGALNSVNVNGNFLLSSGTYTAPPVTVVNGNYTNTGGAFVEGTGSIRFFGTGPQTITNTSGETFYNLRTATTGPLILEAGTDVTVTNLLTMTSGLYNLNGRTLTLGSSGTASQLSRTASTTTNWMYGGTFKRFWLPSTVISSTNTAKYGLYPMGTSTASTYRPFQINSTTTPGAGVGYFSVNHVNTTGTCDLSPYHSDAGTDIQRIRNEQFITSVSGVTGGTYSITVTQTQVPDPAPSVLTDVRLATYVGTTAGTCTASAVGTHAAATGTVDNPTAIRTDVSQAQLDANNDFRISTINASATPLPVELIYFTPSCLSVPQTGFSQGEVMLKWATASETNNDYFTIERSADAVNFTLMGFVQGPEGGNSSTKREYEFIDKQLTSAWGEGSELRYYRLRQTDFNNNQKAFAPVSISCSGNSGFSFAVNSNLSSDGNIYFSINGAANENVLVVLTDIFGRQLYSKIIVGVSNGHLFNIYLQDKLTSGIYFVTASSNDIYLSRKFVVK